MGDRSSGAGAAPRTQLGRRLEELARTVKAHRDAAARLLEKIEDPSAHHRLETLLMALHGETEQAERIPDEGRRIDAHETLVEKARQAEEAVAKAVAEAEKNRRAETAKKVGGGTPEPSPAMRKLIGRFQGLMAEIRRIEGEKAPGAAALKKAAIDAGNMATSTKGIERAEAALDQVEAGIEDAKMQLADAQAEAHRASDPQAGSKEGTGDGATGAETGAKPGLSPEAKKFVDHFKRVMAHVKALEKANNPQAAELKRATMDAGNMGTTPAGIRRGNAALDQIVQRIAKARIDAAQAEAEAKRAKAEAEARAAERFDVKAGARTLKGATRDEALAALRAETNRLNAQLEGGWTYHVDQMNLPADVPFQAWLTSGVDSVKSFFTGEDAAKIPDLDIWDEARDMMIDVRKAERAGDPKAIEALLPRMEQSIRQARGKVGKYDEQMRSSAQTGVEAGKVVEKAGTMAAGELGKKFGGKGGKVAAESAYAAGLAGVEQLTEWFIGSRQQFNAGAIAERGVEQAVGAIVSELVSGALAEPFKKIFGSYLGRAVDDATLKALGLSRDAFMTASQKYIAEFLAKMSATVVKTAVVKQAKALKGKGEPMPTAELMENIASELAKGGSLKLFMDGLKALSTG